MPPAPNSARISYGPKRAPDFNAMSLNYTPRNRHLAHEAAEGCPKTGTHKRCNPGCAAPRCTAVPTILGESSAPLRLARNRVLGSASRIHLRKPLEKGVRSARELRPPKLSQSRGSLHEFENRRSEPVGKRILIGTLAHPPVRHKTGHWIFILIASPGFFESRSMNPRFGRYQASSCGNEESSGSFPAALLRLLGPTPPTSSLSELSECVRVRHRPKFAILPCRAQL